MEPLERTTTTRDPLSQYRTSDLHRWLNNQLLYGKGEDSLNVVDVPLVMRVIGTRASKSARKQRWLERRNKF